MDNYRNSGSNITIPLGKKGINNARTQYHRRLHGGGAFAVCGRMAENHLVSSACRHPHSRRLEIRHCSSTETRREDTTIASSEAKPQQIGGLHLLAEHRNGCWSQFRERVRPASVVGNHHGGGVHH